MKKLQFILLIATLAIPALFAEEKKEEEKKPKDKSVVLKGEKAPKSGYKIFFTENKDSYLHFYGFIGARGDYENTQKHKLFFDLEYFRFYLSGQSSKKWSFHTRFDYIAAYRLSPSSFTTGKEITGTKHEDIVTSEKMYYSPGIYFGRAYASYSPSKFFTLDFGRNLVYGTRYELACGYGRGNEFKADVGHGIKATWNYKKYTTILHANYKSQGETAKLPRAQGNDVIWSVRQNFRHEFNKDLKLDTGVGVIGDTNHSREKYLEFIPDLKVNYKKFQILDEFLYRTHSGGITKDHYSNYISFGYTIKTSWSSYISHLYQNIDNKNVKPINKFELENSFTFDNDKQILIPIATSKKSGEKRSYSAAIRFFYFF